MSGDRIGDPCATQVGQPQIGRCTFTAYVLPPRRVVIDPGAKWTVTTRERK